MYLKKLVAFPISFLVVLLFLASSALALDAWDSTTVYNSGDQVCHIDKEWSAKWWTEGEEPGTTGEWGVWDDLGACAISGDGDGDGDGDGGDGGDGDGDGGTGNEKVIVAYYIAWGIYARNHQISDIPAEKVTHINYAFANVSASGEVLVGDAWSDTDKSFPGDTWDQPLKGNFNQLNKLKEAHPHLKTLISIGGWTWSGRFSDVAATAAGRVKFAKSATEFASRYGFDGVDIDWEYPVGGGLAANSNRPEDKQNFTLLFQELRAHLDAQEQIDNKEYLLTAAVGAGYDKIANWEVTQASSYMDFVNVMTYDFRGAWEPMTAHHSPSYPNPNDPHANPDIAAKYNVNEAITELVNAGADIGKLVLGVPFYGRGWRDVSDPNNNGGLFQPTGSTPPPGTWDTSASGATGVNDYWEILEFEKTSGYTRYWDNYSKAPYLYNPNAYGGHFISYEDTTSLGLKLDYLLQKQMKGAMFWDLSGDPRNNDQESLLHLIHTRLSGVTAQ